MNNFVYHHHFSPFLFQTEIAGQIVGARWYGLAYVLGLLATFATFRWAARRDVLRGFGDEAQAQFIMAVIVGVLAGGRLGYVVQHPQRLWSDPLFVFQVWEGGMAFFGGLVGVMLAMAWTARRTNLSFWRLADVAAFPAAFGLGIGRLANFINGELWGSPTHSNWGVIFPRADALPRHPSQLYEAASQFLLLGALLSLARRYPDWMRQKTGVFAALFLILYGVLRVLTDFYRADDTYFGPLSSGQWASIAVAIAGFFLLRQRFPKTSQVPTARQKMLSLTSSKGESR